MTTITLTTDQLCNIISCIVMSAVDKHPNGLAKAYGYVKHELNRNGITNSDVFEHVRSVLANIYD